MGAMKDAAHTAGQAADTANKAKDAMKH